MPEKRKNDHSNNNNNYKHTNKAEVKIAKVEKSPRIFPGMPSLLDIPCDNLVANILAYLTVEDFIKVTQTSKYFNNLKNHEKLKEKHQFFKTWGHSFDRSEKKKYLSTKLFDEDYNILEKRQKFFNDFGSLIDSNTKQKCLNDVLSIKDYDDLYESYLEINDFATKKKSSVNTDTNIKRKKLLMMILNKSGDDIKKFLNLSRVKFPIFFTTTKSISPIFLAARQGNLNLIYALLEYDILRYAKNSLCEVKFKNVPEEKFLSDIKKSPFPEEYENLARIRVNGTDIISYLKNKDYNLYLKALQIHCFFDQKASRIIDQIDKASSILLDSTLEAALNNHWEIVKFLLTTNVWSVKHIEKSTKLIDFILNNCNDNEILKLCIPALNHIFVTYDPVEYYYSILLKKKNTEIFSAIWEFYRRGHHVVVPNSQFKLLTQSLLNPDNFELLDLLSSTKPPDWVDINGPVLDYLKNSKVTPEKIINMDSLVMIEVYINNYPHVLEDLLRLSLSRSEKISKFLTDKITEEEQKLSDPVNANDAMDEDADASPTFLSMTN